MFFKRRLFPWLMFFKRKKKTREIHLQCWNTNHCVSHLQVLHPMGPPQLLTSRAQSLADISRNAKRNLGPPTKSKYMEIWVISISFFRKKKKIASKASQKFFTISLSRNLIFLKKICEIRAKFR